MVPNRRGVWLSPTGEFHCCVWAPSAKLVELRLVAPELRTLPLQRIGDGYWVTQRTDIAPGMRYFFRLHGHLDRPDPASRSQPDGVHGPSEVLDDHFDWTDRAWRGRSLAEMTIYELHVGTFSPTGTFSGVIDRLDELVELGINTIEVMPIAQFPGARNWGYDGVFPYAVQNSYGGRRAFQTLVNECHARGLAVLLDVVYNHLGPEGNYFGEFGPYFTDRHRTPWGHAINFDGPQRHEVREFFLLNAREWATDCHVDGFRLDATHAIVDNSSRHFLAELSDRIHELGRAVGRPLSLVAETNQNDPRIVTPTAAGGLGMDGQWPDDFSRSLHSVLTGEREGVYADYGAVEHFAKAYREAFVLTGSYSKYRGKAHGRSAANVPADRFVVCLQNHDQVGNRAASERMSQLIDFDSLKLAAAAVILSPHVPLIFMGEEYGEVAPFNYFIDHEDRQLCKAVHHGRIAEFVRHGWKHSPPHPKARRSFETSKLNRELKNSGQHAVLWQYYRQLLRLREEHPAVREARREQAIVLADDATGICVAQRWNAEQEVCVVMNFGESAARLELPEPRTATAWRLVFSSSGAFGDEIPRRTLGLFVAP